MRDKLSVLGIVMYWIPPLVWMSIIFYMSSQQKIGITHQFIGDFILFKFLHIFEYMFLYFLIFRAWYGTFKKQTISKIYLYSFLFVTLFAISDELHQFLTPTRQPKLFDIGIDLLGIFFAYCIIKYNLPILKRIL